MKYAILTLLISVSAFAKPKIYVERIGTKPKKPTSDMVTIIGMEDNDNGTTSLLLDACGTTLLFTMNDEDVKRDPDAVSAEINKVVQKHCKPEGK